MLSDEGCGPCFMQMSVLCELVRWDFFQKKICLLINVCQVDEFVLCQLVVLLHGVGDVGLVPVVEREIVVVERSFPCVMKFHSLRWISFFQFGLLDGVPEFEILFLHLVGDLHFVTPFFKCEGRVFQLPQFFQIFLIQGLAVRQNRKFPFLSYLDGNAR